MNLEVISQRKYGKFINIFKLKKLSLKYHIGPRTNYKRNHKIRQMGVKMYVPINIDCKKAKKKKRIL
jgi:hypothetical protein